MQSSYTFGNRLFCPIDYQDLADIKDWRNTQMDICRQYKPLTDYNQEEWWKELSTSDKQVIFAIRENNKLIGYCGLVYIDYINRHAEYSILVDKRKHKKYDEIFKDTTDFICNYGFCTLNLHKITAETFEFRNHQIELLEKYGFEKQGILQEHQFKDGSYWDSILHAIFKEGI